MSLAAAIELLRLKARADFADCLNNDEEQDGMCACWSEAATMGAEVSVAAAAVVAWQRRSTTMVLLGAEKASSKRRPQDAKQDRAGERMHGRVQGQFKNLT